MTCGFGWPAVWAMASKYVMALDRELAWCGRGAPELRCECPARTSWILLYQRHERSEDGWRVVGHAHTADLVRAGRDTRAPREHIGVCGHVYRLGDQWA